MLRSCSLAWPLLTAACYVREQVEWVAESSRRSVARMYAAGAPFLNAQPVKATSDRPLTDPIGAGVISSSPRALIIKDQHGPAPHAAASFMHCVDRPRQ